MEPPRIPGRFTHALLSKADEHRLGALIQVGRAAAQELASSGPGLTSARKQKLIAAVQDGDSATSEFVHGNLRLVVAVARRYRSSGLPFLDLVQEGNFGLMHAVVKFDHRKGFKFSTYATWWIRKAIVGGIAMGGRSIRVPEKTLDLLKSLQLAEAVLEVELNRRPTMDEVAERLGTTVEELSDARRIPAEPLSLSHPMGEDGGSEFGDIVEDRGAPPPEERALVSAVPGEVAGMLGYLQPREREILRLRFGLDRGGSRTLEEVGRGFRLTKERIRQIESRALCKLRHPSLPGDIREVLPD